LHLLLGRSVRSHRQQIYQACLVDGDTLVIGAAKIRLEGMRL
jgi:hypothetical protein